MPYLSCKKIENDVYNFPTWQYCKYKDIFDSRIIINSTAKFYISISYQKDLLSIDTRIFTPSNEKLALRFICLAYLLNIIFSCITSTFISFLYFGQYSGNFTRTVSSYTFVLVFPPQIGQWIQREFFRLSFTLYTSNNGIAPR